MNNKIKEIEIRTTKLLHELGIPANLNGYHYLRSAIKMIVGNNNLMCEIVKTVYPLVAKEYKATPTKVERSIRHAIEVAWERGNPVVLTSYFGYTVQSSKGRPTNAEFIAMIADNIYLQLKYKEKEN